MMTEMDAIQDKMRPVYIEGKLAGEIPEGEWEYIVAQVSTDRRLWEAQVKNLLRVAARVAGFFFLGVPIGLYWTAAMLAWLGKPIAIGGIQGHVGALLDQPALVAAGLALAVGAMMALGLRLGYVNFFARARSAWVKAYLDLQDQPGHCTVR